MTDKLKEILEDWFVNPRHVRWVGPYQARHFGAQDEDDPIVYRSMIAYHDGSTYLRYLRFTMTPKELAEKLNESDDGH